MPSIRFSGMASGLPSNIVDQIMEAERIPVKQMEAKKGEDEDKLKMVNELEAKVTEIPKSLTELVGIRGFTNHKLTTGDPNALAGVIDPEKAVNGEYSVEVIQLAQKPSALSTGFPDKDKTQIGTGYIKFDTPEGKKEVYITSANSTLEGVSNSINAAGFGLHAQVINDRTDKDNPFKLMVAGLGTGDDKQVEFPTIYILDGDQDFSFEKSNPAHNAKVKMDGFVLEFPDNTVKDLIPGVNLELKQAQPGKPIAVTVKEDFEVISGKIKTFVDAYNGALAWIQAQSKLTKDKAGHERLGPLGGDGMLRSIENNLRTNITTPQYGVNSNIQLVNELGIEFNRNGTLNFSQDKFNKKLTSDPVAVGNFLRGDGFKTGFVPMVQRRIGDLMNQAYGPLATRKRGIDEKIKAADERIQRKETQLEKKEESLRTKFSNLESTMSKLNQQSASVGGLGAAISGGKG